MRRIDKRVRQRQTNVARRAVSLRILVAVGVLSCGLVEDHEPCSDEIRSAFEDSFAAQIELLRIFSVKADHGYDKELFAADEILSAWLREAPASNTWRAFKRDSAESSSYNEYGDMTAGELHLASGQLIEFCGYVGTNSITGGEFELRVRRSFFTD